MSYRCELRKIYQSEGLFGFTRGYSAMLMRDGPGFAMYFFLFDLFKRKLGVSGVHHYDDEHTFHPSTLSKKFLAGGSAGTIVWTVCYPWDTIKSTMQTHRGPDRLKMRHVIKNVYN